MSQTTLSALATRMANNVRAFLTTRPEPRWDPTTVTIRGWTSRFRAIWSAQGLGTAYNKLRMENWLRPNGQLIGTDVNGNKYFEDLNAPYGRTRWVEYPTVPGTWALEDKFDASMVHPDWHGWLHYMHDAPGSKVSAEYSKPFKQHHRVNQTMLRPCYTTPAGITSKHHEEGLPAAFHTPPGSIHIEKPRGKLGHKYQSWDPSGEAKPSELRNYVDNTKILGMP
mmetsp:Transcript_14349/g.42327  ORF Transcript_14349/g.42327 Transcript_14349/m.42327 type:complete len:224 (+) Transcript_14349:59-730(+)